VTLNSQRAFAAAEQTFAQLESAIARDQIAVVLALSGGWSETTEKTEPTDAVKQ
jgi:outer membrane protein TolC